MTDNLFTLTDTLFALNDVIETSLYTNLIENKTPLTGICILVAAMYNL